MAELTPAQIEKAKKAKLKAENDALAKKEREAKREQKIKEDALKKQALDKAKEQKAAEKKERDAQKAADKQKRTDERKAQQMQNAKQKLLTRQSSLLDKVKEIYSNVSEALVKSANFSNISPEQLKSCKSAIEALGNALTELQTKINECGVLEDLKSFTEALKKISADITSKKAECASAIKKFDKQTKEQPIKNGVKRPKAGGLCDQAWTVFDDLYAKNKDFLIADALEEGEKRGLNASNIRCEFGVWRKYCGLPSARDVAAKRREVLNAQKAAEKEEKAAKKAAEKKERDAQKAAEKQAKVKESERKEAEKAEKESQK